MWVSQAGLNRTHSSPAPPPRPAPPRSSSGGPLLLRGKMPRTGSHHSFVLSLMCRQYQARLPPPPAPCPCPLCKVHVVGSGRWSAKVTRISTCLVSYTCPRARGARPAPHLWAQVYSNQGQLFTWKLFTQQNIVYFPNTYFAGLHGPDSYFAVL